MVSRAIIAYTARVHEMGFTQKRKNLSELGPGKIKLTRLFNGYVEALREDPERARENLARRYNPVTRVSPSAQTVLVEVEPGYYGLGGSTRDVFTHEQRLEHQEGDAAGTPARVFLAQPPDAEVALLFAERVGTVSAGPYLMDGFTLAFKAAMPGLNLKFAPVIEPEAWLADAMLEQVIVEDPRFSRDIADGDTNTTVVGRRETRLLPPRGAGTLPKRVLLGLTNGSLTPEQVLDMTFDSPDLEKVANGVEAVDVPAEAATPRSERTVKVKVRGKNGRGSKTFKLSNPRTPTIAYDFGEDAVQPSDVAFRKACTDLIPDLIGEEAQWKDEYHQESTWPADDSAYRMPLPPADGS